MKFRFDRANAVKAALLPVYAVVGLLAYVAPRNRKLWVFGRKSGFGEGPLRVLEEVRARDPGLRLVWLAQDDRDVELAACAGIECAPRASLQGFWVTLRASVIVITHGLGDVCRPAALGAKVVQLWHGTPLKRIGLDAPATYGLGRGLIGRVAGWLMQWPYKLTYRLPYAYVTACDVATARFRSAFGVADGKIMQVGDPRCDCLYVDDDSKARSVVRAKLSSIWGGGCLPSKMYLYAPTWRDGERDPGAPSVEELNAIVAACERQDAALVIRSHPHGYGAEMDSTRTWGRGRIHFLPSSVLNDVTPFLCGFDALITDYSAIAMDFAILGRPIYFFAPDLVGYVERRGMYEPYEAFSGGDWHESWRALIDAIESDAAGHESLEARCRRVAAMRSRYQSFDDGGASIRLVDKLLDRSASED